MKSTSLDDRTEVRAHSPQACLQQLGLIGHIGRVVAPGSEGRSAETRQSYMELASSPMNNSSTAWGRIMVYINMSVGGSFMLKFDVFFDPISCRFRATISQWLAENPEDVSLEQLRA